MLTANISSNRVEYPLETIGATDFAEFLELQENVERVSLNLFE